MSEGNEVSKYVTTHFSEYLKSFENFKRGNYNKALISTFLKLEKSLKSEASNAELNEYKSVQENNDSLTSIIRNDSQGISFNSGCVGCVVLITKKKIYVANLGNTKCLLCKSGKIYELSKDHTPSNPLEKKRIDKANGKIISNKIDGFLKASRTLGDYQYKNNLTLSNESQIIISTPDICEEVITPECEYLFIGSNGICECLSPLLIESMINVKMKKLDLKNPGSTIRMILEELFESVLASSIVINSGIGCDNMSCIVIKFKKTKQ